MTYFSAKKKGVRRAEKIIEEEPGLTVSTYGEVYDFLPRNYTQQTDSFFSF